MRQRFLGKRDAEGRTPAHAKRRKHGAPNSHDRHLVSVAQRGAVQGEEEHGEVGEVQGYADRVSLLDLVIDFQIYAVRPNSGGDVEKMGDGRGGRVG